MSALINMPDAVPASVERTEIPFGEWLPDQPHLNNPGALEALNVIPAEGSYAPFLQFVSKPGMSAISSPIRGATVVLGTDDVTEVFAGTDRGVHASLGGGFVRVFVTTVGTDFSWQFIRVNEQMVLLHPEEPLHRVPVDIIQPSVVLGGSPPSAHCGAQVGDFLMVGNLTVDLDDGGDAFPHRVRWGGFNNIDLPWISDPTTQADFQDMPPEGGPIIAIAGRQRGTIYQARMISRATYRGPPSIFDIEVVEPKRGAIARDCVINVGPYQFFIAEDGFFLWNGTNSTPIGDQKVNRYFFGRLHYSDRARICSAHDPTNGCVMWAFPTTSEGSLDEIMIYSYRENRWSHSIQTVDYILSAAKSNTSEEELTSPTESYEISFDSDYFLGGGQPYVGAFNTAHRFGLFSGPPLAASIDTGEFSGPDGRRVFTNNVRPLVDLATPSAKIQIIARDQMIGQPELYSGFATQEIDGQCPIIADARYMRFRLQLDAGLTWTHATGVEVARKATGVF